MSDDMWDIDLERVGLKMPPLRRQQPVTAPDSHEGGEGAAERVLRRLQAMETPNTHHSRKRLEHYYRIATGQIVKSIYD